MDVEQLFVRTLADLENRTVATDEYEVLMSAGLLRKLLMEGITLADKVNSRYKLRIRYLMNDVSAYERIIHEDAPVFWSLLEGIDPDCPIAQMPGTRAPIHATRDQLLARRVMRMSGTWITVRDLIDQLAHIDGAVHSHEPKTERELVLQAAAQFFHVGDMPGGVAQIRSIGRVVVRGLTPLRDAVRSATASPRPAASRLANPLADRVHNLWFLLFMCGRPTVRSSCVGIGIKDLLFTI